MRTLTFLAALAVAFLFAWKTVQPPEAASADAPQAAFSATRALADVRAMSREPHPTGSRENAQVRDRLVRRLEGLDLRVSTQRANATFQREAGYVTGGSIENLIAILPANAPDADPDAPAVLLMSHYDSAVGSPGGADDAAGVASSLEIVRALQAEDGPRRRDLILLITDGEEQGLLGAGAFFDSHPLRERIGAVVNMETRGASGRAFMFETGRDNGAMMDLYARSVSRPSTTSLASFLYSVLPNDTDFTHARAAGLPGFNLAFIGDPYEYHSPTSTAATLDAGSLQDLGGQSLDLTRALVTEEAIPAARANAVFADIFGLFTVVYPAWVGWLPLLLAGLVLAGLIWRSPERGRTLRGAALGFAGGLGVTLAAAALCQGVFLVTGASTDFVLNRPLLGRFGLLELSLFAVSLAAALLVGRLTLGGRRDDLRRHEPGAIGLVLFGLILGVVFQFLAPEAALIASWPALVGALAILARRRFPIVGGPLAFVLGAIGTAWMLAIAHGVFVGVGATTPAGPGAFTALVLIPTAVLLARSAASSLTVPAGGLALITGLILALFLRFAPQATVEHPLPTQVLYVVDPAASTARLVAPLGATDYWTRDVLRSQAGEIEEVALPALSGRPQTSADAAPVPAAPPSISVTPVEDGLVRIAVQAAPSVREIRLTFEGGVSDLVVGGQARDAALDGDTTVIRWADPSRGFEVTLRPSAGARLHWAAFSDGWPAEAEALPRRTPDRMAWGSSDSLVVIGETALAPAAP